MVRSATRGFVALATVLTTLVGVSGIASAAKPPPPTPAPTTLAPSTFEIDGNLIVDSTVDWANFDTDVNAPGVQHVSCGNESSTCRLDMPSGQTDNSLGQGSKDDLSSMTVVTGQVPNNKSDLLRFYVASEHLAAPSATPPNPDFLYFGWVRANTLGTANFSIELDQRLQPQPPSTSPPSTGGPWTLNRIAGDSLILFDFASGGNQVNLGLSKWVTTGNAKQVCQANSTVPCWGKVKSLNSSGAAIGAVNDPASFGVGQVDDPICSSDPTCSTTSGQITTLPADTFGEAAVNLEKAGILTGTCGAFASVSIRSRSSAAFDSELKDFIAPVDAVLQRPVDVSGAKANGSSLGLRASDTGLGIDTGPIPTDNISSLESPPDGIVQSAQTGAGGVGEEGALASIDLPSSGSTKGSVLHAGLLHAISDSSVTQAPAQSRQFSDAHVADVNILNGTVKASVVEANTETTAGPDGVTYDSTLSGLQNLFIDDDGSSGPDSPVAYNQVNPNASIVPLNATFFGAGSYVQLYQEAVTVSSPPPGTPLGTAVTYGVTLNVTMLAVHVTDRDHLINAVNCPDPTASNSKCHRLDVTIGQTSAHAEFPTTLCIGAQEVSGHAFIAKEMTNPSLLPLTIGYVSIPQTGGHSHQSLDMFGLGSNGSVVNGGVAHSDSYGTFDASTATASSEADAADVCVLLGAITPGQCLVYASAVQSQANSSADGSSRSSNADGTQLVGVQVAGTAVALNPAPNTRIDLPGGLGYVVLNEQTCEDGGTFSFASGHSTCSQGTVAGKSGITIRSIHVVLTDTSGNVIAEVIVAEAHSDAQFIPV